MKAVVYGEENTVLTMLERHPSLLMERGHVARGVITDYSERTYSGLTTYQLAICAGDDVMATKMKDVYLKKYDGANAQTILDAQFDELFPNGYQAHLDEQKARTFNFDTILSAIDNATAEELQAALNNPDVDSELGLALTEFRAAFTAQSLNEKIFNPNHLQKAFDIGKAAATTTQLYNG